MHNEGIATRQGGLGWFVVLTFALTWGLASLLLLFPDTVAEIFGRASMAHPLVILALAGPAIAATVLALEQGGVAGVRDLYSRIVRWRFGVHWYAAVLIGVPLITFLASAVAGRALQSPDLSTALAVIQFLINHLVAGPLVEELGWRGFALPRLLGRFTPFSASLILGIIWGIWHIPQFLGSDAARDGVSVLLFLFYALCLSVIATWLFVHTGGSVLITILFYFFVNVARGIFGTPFPPSVLNVFVVTVLILALDRGLDWFHRRNAWQPATRPRRAARSN